MKVKRNQLQEGCILKSDIKLQTNNVFMKKKTILTYELLKVIDAFLVEIVDVEDKLVTGEKYTPISDDEVTTPEEETSVQSKSFIGLYLDAVQSYRKLFQDWQAGSIVNFIDIRTILLPIFEELIEAKSDILQLHHYCTRDNYLYHHAITVGILSAYIGNKLSLTKAEIIQLGLAGAMADSGMSKLPAALLNKKGALASYEYEEIKKHPIYSYKMLKGVTGVTENILIGVLQHHEREDGSGYPLGIKSNKIHLFSQIIAVSDVYHAMCSQRLYRSKQSPYRALEVISKENFGKFRHTVVQCFLDSFLNFSIGKLIRLSSGEEGEIVFIDPQNPTRPMVKLTDGQIISLVNHKEIFIDELVL